MRAANEQVLGGWTTAFDQMLEEEAGIRSDGKWVRGAADVFGILGISRAEIRHTKFIAWLMDPAAQHGFGPRFLELVLARTFPGEKFEGLDRATTECEVVRGRCRVDIVVYGPAFTVVIEAKVDAGEAQDQCDYQFEQFSREPGARFIFLTPRGVRPASATGDAADAYVSLSFRSIRDDLRDALASSSNAAGRGAAEDYLRTLERAF